MRCTDIIDKFYDGIARNYTDYIGQQIDKVMGNLSVDHVILPYKLPDLKNMDVIIWESKRDRCAHVTIFNNNKFYYVSKQGEIKVHQVLLTYKNMLIPKYIVRLEGCK